MRCLPVFLSFLFIGSLSFVFSQQGQGGSQHQEKMSIEKRVAEMKTQLGLSDDQVTQITSIMQKQRTTMQTIRDKYGNDHDGMREEMSKLRESTDSEISAVLTDLQRETYNEIIAQRRQGRRGQGQGNKETKPSTQRDSAQ